MEREQLLQILPKVRVEQFRHALALLKVAELLWSKVSQPAHNRRDD